VVPPPAEPVVLAAVASPPDVAVLEPLPPLEAVVSPAEEDATIAVVAALDAVPSLEFEAPLPSLVGCAPVDPEPVPLEQAAEESASATAISERFIVRQAATRYPSCEG
jgi:hypothetical protein